MVVAVPLRVVFFGTPAFAVPTVQAILGSRHELVAVVTQPDKPRGRGQKTSDSPVKARAMEAGIDVMQPATLKDPVFAAELERRHTDIGVVAAYGKILPETIINTPRLGMINVHASLLPKYRGAAPVHRAVIAGEAETGVTIMRVVKALDAGPMLAEGRRPIGPDETSEQVERELAVLGASLLVDTLDRLAEGGITERPQSDADATYAARLTRENGHMDWSRPAVVLHNQVRGLHPWPHAYATLEGQRIILLRTSIEREAASHSPGAGSPGALTATGGQLFVSTGHGRLQILELQVEGKRRMTAREFLAGHQIAPDAHFSP